MAIVQDCGKDPKQGTISIETRGLYSEGKITGQYRCIPHADEEWSKNARRRFIDEYGREPDLTQTGQFTIKIVDGKPVIEYHDAEQVEEEKEEKRADEVRGQED